MWSVDDHSADTADSPDAAERKANATAIMKAWDNPATHARAAQDKQLKAKLARPGGLLAIYCAYNAPGTPAQASHRGYHEAYLDQMHDVLLADVKTVLR